ncbi:XylR family transcriptional regulator [Schlesneria paludicola]|uniref:XylR family transcriptional regulator n=1 Tax=Schlesneria paludicola TaxID=360056 RepID=UPI00029A5B58|nr:DNA-binding transcriptional regulator [Schlesneria paludicola]
MNAQPPLRKVLLLVEASSAFTRRLIRGVASYSQSHGHWLMTLRERRTSKSLPLLCDLSLFDGVIARMESEEVHQKIAESGVPFVNVSGTNFNKRIPWVTVNNDSVVRLVVQEFRNSGHQDFAFFGPVRHAWSCHRETAFRQLISKMEMTFCGTFLADLHGPKEPTEVRRIGEWLKTLPSRVAIMAANDFCGSRLLQTCHTAGFSVPDQVAVIGVNNDELLCELSYPTLTSVSPNTEKIGHEAADILNQLMSGRSVSPKTIVVEPLGIESRRSTENPASVDPFVGLAFRFIQQHACDGINVEDLLKIVPMSRTSLETSFRQLVGRSPHHEITRIRQERAKRLLADGILPIAEVARRCGYSTVDYFSAAFKRLEGVSPSAYRRINT